MLRKPRLTLPYELILLIGDELGRKDLKSFLQVNRCFAQLLTPLLNRFAFQPRHRKTALYWAAATENKELVRLLVEKGKSFLVRKDDENQAIIFKAPEKQRVAEVVDLVLEQGSRIVVQDTFDFCTPLQDAARYGHKFMLRSLLEMGADTSVRDLRGWTALHHAVWESDRFAVRLLLNKGANVNVQENEGMTPLHFAASLGNKLTASLLLAYGADVALRDAGNCTAIEMAGMRNRDMVSLILKNSGPDFRSSTEQTALHLAAFIGDVSVVNTVLAKGVAVNSRDTLRNTALHEAAGAGHFDIVVLLLDRGADVDAQDCEGITPLHCSLNVIPLESRESIAMALLDGNANVNIEDRYGNSAFDYVVGSIETYSNRLLIDYFLEKANLNFRAKTTGRTTLHIAAQYASIECFRRLLKRGANITDEDDRGWSSLHFAAIWPSDDAKIRLLLEKGADVATKTKDGKTAIDIAYEHGEMRVSLLQRADVNFRTRKKRQSLLHLAAQIGDKRLAKTLLDRGIGVNLQDDSGSTALHYAAFALEKDVVKLLLDKGADNTIQDAHGMTPVCELLQLVEGGSLSGELVGLLAKGFKLDERDAEGLTLLDHAAMHGHEEGMKVLQGMGADAMIKDPYGLTSGDRALLYRQQAADSREECLRMGMDMS